MILYHATINRIKTESETISIDEKMTLKQINADFILNDLFFWLLVFIVVFIILEISSPVSIQYVSFYLAFSFAMLLFTTCSLAYTELVVLRSISLFIWGVQALIIIVMTNASILDGSCLLFVNIFLAIFYYMSVVEQKMTIIKFLNMRIWCSLVLNFCFVLIYINNIICIDIVIN